jgi:hypothetical protein
MTKKQRKVLFDAAFANADRFCPDLESLSDAEVEELLNSAGCNSNELTTTFGKKVKTLVVDRKIAAKMIPKHLQYALDCFSDPMLPAKNEDVALRKAKKWFTGFVIPPELSTSPTILRAYKKKGDLSQKDSSSLDALEKKLLSEVNRRKT